MEDPLGILVTVVRFLVILTVLIMVHEAGHFFAARAIGVKVLEFGWGFPPRLFALYRGRTRVALTAQTQPVGVASLEALAPGVRVRVHSRANEDGSFTALLVESLTPGRPSAALPPGGDRVLVHEGIVRENAGDALVIADMLYSINWLPIGGFVRMAGEQHLEAPASLASRGPGARFFVLAAGSAMNLALALLIFTFLFAAPEERYEGRVQVVGVAAESPAERAGLQGGDVILEADGHPVYNTGVLRERILLNLGSETEFLVMRPERLISGGAGFGGDAGPVDSTVRDTEPFSVTLVPRWAPPEGQGNIGVNIVTVEGRVVTHPGNVLTAIPRGVVRMGETLALFRNEVLTWFVGSRGPQLAGPVGIAQVSAEVAEAGWRSLLWFSAVLSLNLAIINLLPIPALDGGRIVFVAVEWLRRGKRIPPEREGLVHAVGFAVLISAVVVITYFDIVRIVSGGSVVN